MSEFHAVVWLDHFTASVFHFNTHNAEKQVIISERSERLHLKGRVIGTGRQTVDHAYYQNITKALQGAKEILVIGPATAKLELMRHILQHDKALSRCIAGQKTVGKISDRGILAYAKKYFKAYDRMTG